MSQGTTGSELTGDGKVPRSIEALTRAIEALGCQLEDAAVSGEQTPESYCRSRVHRIARGETPIKLRPGPALILHVIAESAFAGSAKELDIAKAEFLVFERGGNSTFDSRGRLVWAGSGGSTGQPGYAHMTPLGCVEAVEVLSGGGQGERSVLRIDLAQRLILRGATIYSQTLASLGVTGGLSIGVSLIGAKGYAAIITYDHFPHESVPIAENVVRLPLARVPSPVTAPMLPAPVLRPALDVLWRTAGAPACGSFDAAGKYIG